VLGGIIGIWLTLLVAALLAGIIALKYPRKTAPLEATA
jgi:hypothetical protein